LRFALKNSFRVFYDVNHEAKTVSVLVIGMKPPSHYHAPRQGRGGVADA
jgi:hypothetical protein